MGRTKRTILLVLDLAKKGWKPQKQPLNKMGNGWIYNAILSVLAEMEFVNWYEGNRESG